MSLTPLLPLASPFGIGVRASATVDIRAFPSHAFLQQVTIADPCGGGGPYGHHPVAIAFPGSIVAAIGTGTNPDDGWLDPCRLDRNRPHACARGISLTDSARRPDGWCESSRP